MKKISSLLLTFIIPTLFAQSISGTVKDKTTKESLTGVVIQILPSKKNVSTDLKGNFRIEISKSDQYIIATLPFYKVDTILLTSKKFNFELQSINDLEAVVIKARSSTLDELSPIHTEVLTMKTLAKAACCNLSESFETNASVSVNYSDAVTGAKQIQLLGLSGNYIQTNLENIPGLRGLGYTFGLNYVPGSWIQSIDIAKGSGSVLNGYENMAGAINIELKKPENSEKFFLNTYLNSQGRTEINLNAATKINKNWSYGFLGHGSTLQTQIDQNNDNFYDLPKYTQTNVINRIKYESDKMMFQAGIKYLFETRLGGELPEISSSKPNYQFTNKTNRIEFFTKTAKLFQNKPYKGLGWIVSGTLHDGITKFGFKNYLGKQQTIYSNLIYQGIIGSTNHTFKTGLSYLYDNFDETYAGLIYARKESVPGAFLEYSYKYFNKFDAVLGLRYDKHNLAGTQITPRVHLKYDIDANTILRASAGRGFKIANIIAENYGYFISQRALKVLETLNPEVSWNYGGSIFKEFGIAGSKANLTLDYFKTEFKNQVVVDAEHQGTLYFYNLKGKSYSNSFQAELNVFPSKQTEIKAAYRYLDVKQSLGFPSNQNVLMSKMFMSPSRILFNIGYALPFDKWKFDFTTQWNSKKRIPNLTEGYIHGTYSEEKAIFAPSFFNFNAQITRTFKKWDTYLGGENLGNFTQPNPIISAADPFSKRFDAGMAWGPIVGRVLYWGVRYKIK